MQVNRLAPVPPAIASKLFNVRSFGDYFPTVSEAIDHVVNLFLFRPLESLYVHGPTLSGYGFHGGKPRDAICAQITNTDTHIWQRNPTQCAEIIEKQVQSYVVVLLVLFYYANAYGLYKSLARALARKFFC